MAHSIILRLHLHHLLLQYLAETKAARLHLSWVPERHLEHIKSTTTLYLLLPSPKRLPICLKPGINLDSTLLIQHL